MLKRKYDPLDSQGRSKYKYESSGKTMMWSVVLLGGLLLVYRLIQYSKIIISSL